MQIKQQEAAKSLLESQIKNEKERATKYEKDFEKEKKERVRWESKITDLDADLSVIDAILQRFIFFTYFCYLLNSIDTAYKITKREVNTRARNCWPKSIPRLNSQ